MSKVRAVHLVGDGHSGKGVRYRTLSRADIDTILASTSNEVGPEAKGYMYLRTERLFGAQSMIVAITKNPIDPKLVAKEPNVPLLKRPEIEWVPWNEEANQLTEKDWDLLKNLYGRLHLVTKDEVDEILGKAIDVGEG